LFVEKLKRSLGLLSDELHMVEALLSNLYETQTI